MTSPRQISSALKETHETAAVSLITDIGNYYTAVTEVVKYTAEQEKACIYITSTVPSSVIIEQLTSEGMDISHVHFIDAISFMVGKAPEGSEQVIFIESPTMIETMMLKVHAVLKRLGDEPKSVFIDSVNTLALHNDEKVVQEFLHYIINALRVRGVPSIVLSIVDQTPEDLEIILKLVCDEVIEVSGEEEDI